MREAVASGEALGPPSPMQPGMNQTYGDYLAAQPQQAGTYRNTWGPTENPFTAFGLNQEYVPPERPRRTPAGHGQRRAEPGIPGLPRHRGRSTDTAAAAAKGRSATR